MQKVKIAYYLKPAFKGLLRVLAGAAIAALFVIAIFGYAAIPSEDGYVAVFDFIASTATLIVALANMYLIGR